MPHNPSSRKYRVELTRAQLEALREAATFRLAGEDDGTFDRRVLDRADNALIAALEERGNAT